MSSTTTNTVYTTSSLITLLPSEPSICIPRLFMNIQKERVLDVFADLFGHNAIERVDMIERKNDAGEEYKRAFVHFKSWPRTEQATEVRLKLLNGDQVKIMYDQPWFWLISASRVPRPEDAARRERDTSRPFIVIEEDHAKTKDTHHRTPYQPRQQQNRSESRPQQQHQHRHQERHHQQEPRYDVRPPRRDYDSRDRYEREQRYEHHERYDERRYDERRDQGYYEPRERYDERRDYHHQQQRSHYQPRQEQRSSSYTRRIESRRPPHLDVTVQVTPKKSAPEIAEWIEKSKKAPGAPKKPRLVIQQDDEDTGAGAGGAGVKSVENRGRKLSFDEQSSDVEAVPSTPSTPPVQQSGDK